MRPRIYLLPALLYSILALAPIAQGAEFIDLGRLPDLGFFVYANDVSADGRVVVGSISNKDGRTEGFVWTRENGMTGLGMGGGARAVSGDGRTVVGRHNAPHSVMRWTAETGAHTIISGGGTLGAISFDGQVVVGQNQDAKPYRWTSDSGVEFLYSPLGHPYGAAYGVSSDGDVVVGSVWGGGEGPRPFRWSVRPGEAFGTELINVPDGCSVFAHVAVARNGDTLLGGIHCDGVSSGFRWRRETGFQPLSGIQHVIGTSADGALVIGNRSIYGSPQKYAVWREATGGRFLDEMLVTDHGIDPFARGLDFSVSAARDPNDGVGYALSDDGLTIVGHAHRISDTLDAGTAAWLAKLDPIDEERFPFQVFVEPGAEWSYLDDGSDQGTAWRASDFDDSSWQQGPSPLGYYTPVATEVGFGPNAERKYATTYFRRAFDVDLDGGAAVHRLTLNLRRDDAAAVYLNGTEVFRDDSLRSNAAYDEYASLTFGFPTGFRAIAIDPALLVAGANYLAVEVHQGQRNSIDLVFDAELVGRLRISQLLGDTNADGVVDLVDLNNVRNNFGVMGDDVVGDANQDGVVDVVDLNLIRNNFGRADLPVPEPGGAAIAIISVTLLAIIRSRPR